MSAGITQEEIAQLLSGDASPAQVMGGNTPAPQAPAASPAPAPHGPKLKRMSGMRGIKLDRYTDNIVADRTLVEELPGVKSLINRAPNETEHLERNVELHQAFNGGANPPKNEAADALFSGARQNYEENKNAKEQAEAEIEAKKTAKAAEAARQAKIGSGITSALNAGGTDREVYNKLAGVTRKMRNDFYKQNKEFLKDLGAEEKQEFFRKANLDSYTAGLDENARKNYKTFTNDVRSAHTNASNLVEKTKRQLGFLNVKDENANRFGQNGMRQMTEDELRSMSTEKLQEIYEGMGGRKNLHADKGASKWQKYRGEKNQQYRQTVKDNYIDAITKRQDVLNTRLQNSEKALDIINNYDTKNGAFGEVVDRFKTKEGAVGAAGGRQPGHGTPIKGGKFSGAKGKLGAVAGLAALAGVTGLMFSGGKQSNAQLYNPNPQPQYY